MISSVVDMFLFSKTSEEAKRNISLLEETQDLPKKYAEKIRENALSNDSIAQSNECIKRVNIIMQKYNLPELGKEGQAITDLFDEDIPF
jgi:hypothetical protein